MTVSPFADPAPLPPNGGSHTTTSPDQPTTAAGGFTHRFSRNVLIYLLAPVLIRAVSFVMLPVYTRYLTPADYGILQLLEITVEVVNLFISAGATSGVFRFYFKTQSLQERRRVMTTALYIQAGLDVLGMLLILAAAPWLHSAFLKGAGAVWMIRVAAVNFFLTTLVTVPLIYAQAEQRAAFVTATQIVKLIIQLGLNIIFVVGYRAGSGGIILSTLIANSLLGPALTIWMLRQTGVRGTWSAARQLRRFGLPYQIVTIGTFTLVFGDRFFLQHSRNVTEVGLYGLAYQFGFLIVQLVTAPFLKAWEPLRHQYAHLPAEARDERYRAGFLYFFVLHVTFVTGLCIGAVPMIHVLTTAPFFSAARFIPVIAIAYLFSACTDYFDHGMQASERTVYSAYATWASVIVVVILYATLIPRFGGMGAAAATLISFALRTALTYYFAQRVWPVRWDWGAPIRVAVLGSAAALLGWILQPARTLPQITLAVVLFTCYVAGTWAWVLGPSERATVLQSGARLLGRRAFTCGRGT